MKRSKRLRLMNKDLAKNNGMLSSFLFQPEGFGRWRESRRCSKIESWNRLRERMMVKEYKNVEDH